MYFAITATTRRQRRSENNGVDYHFVSRERFLDMIDGGELLEWAEVYGNFYGVPKQQIREALQKGQDVVVKVDVQGAATIKRLVPEAILIFITPPTMEALEQRLKRRRTESDADLKRRIDTAREEMEQQKLFDHVVVNDEVGRVVSEIDDIVVMEKRRSDRSAVEL